MLTTTELTRTDLNGVTVRHAVDGPDGAPALLLINSLGTDHRMWAPQVEVFAARYRVIRYDSRGQGGTSAPPLPYSIDDLGSDAVALLDHLDIERAHVCGVSLGGFLALWLAINHPKRLSGAVFADTAARIGSVEGWNERIAAVETGGMASIRERVIERFFSEAFREENRDVVRQIGNALGSHDPQGYIGHCTVLRNTDLRDEVETIDLPALVIAGTADASTPTSESRWLHERIDGSRIEELESAGHLSNLEKPTVFNQAVLVHLAEHDI